MVNRYCVVLIVGNKDGKPAFMLDPHVTFPNPDKVPEAMDDARARARMVRYVLNADQSLGPTLAEVVRAQVGTGPYRVEPVVVTGIAEDADDFSWLVPAPAPAAGT